MRLAKKISKGETDLNKYKKYDSIGLTQAFNHE